MLNIGGNVPQFSLPDQNGKTVSYEDFKGKWLVMYFYPKDNTPGCTTEACNFRDEYSQIQNMGAEVVGISKDSIKRHENFAAKYELPFTLISDENGTLCEDLGVWQEKSMYGKKYMGIVRSTFIIDPEGKIAKVYPKVSVKTHTNEVVEDLKNLM